MVKDTTQRSPGDQAVFSARNLTKTFGPTRALDDFSLDLHRGEIVALVGQNGSGKSTFFKILSGYHSPDGGRLLVRGEDVRLPIGPAELGPLGFSFVHQDLGLAPGMSVLENVRLTSFDTGPLWKIDWRGERRRVRKTLEAFELHVDPDTPVAELTQAERTIVAVTRALAFEEGHDATLLVLDEPTAYLPQADRERLFGAMRQAAAQGVAVVFATHRLDEAQEVADRIAVLRDGRLVETFATADVDERRLVRALIGRELGELYPDPPPRGGEEVVLSVDGLAGGPVRGVTFDLHRGEILGLTGVIGMGQEEIPYLLFGASSPEAGEIRVGGSKPARWTPRDALANGIALLPADRPRAGAIPAATLKENVTLPRLRTFFRGGRIRHRTERETVRELLTTFDVRPRPDPELLLRQLSGGNQQKALLGKWLRLDGLRVLLLHEPTQGVDIGSRQAIFGFIRDAAAAGTAIVMVSAEYEDLARLCRRVLVLRGGRIAAELSGAELTPERIVEQSYVGAAREASA
jgi:ribose transport system ATP-binding protein